MSDNQINKKSTLEKIHKILHDNFKDKNFVIKAIHRIVEEGLKNKKAEIIVIRSAMCIGVLAFAFLLVLVFMLFSPSAKSRSGSELVKVLKAVPVKLGNVELKLAGYGTVEPIQEVTLSSELKGRIAMKSVDLKEGELVKKGQILAKIEAIDYEIALQKASAEVMRLRSELIQLKQYIKDWTEELEKEKNILALCVSDYQRQLKLQRRGASAQKSVETAQRVMVTQRKALINGQSNINQRTLQVAILQASLKAAVSQEKQASINLERSVIRCPFNGRLKTLYIDHGELAAPGTKLFDIADDTKLEIPVSLDASEVAYAMGMIKHESEKQYSNWFKNPENRDVKIQWTEGTDLCIWTGRVERVKDFCADTRTVTFIVRPVKFLKGSSGYFPLLSGMFCKVFFNGITLKNAATVSWLAIQLDGNAYVINKKGRLEQRKVKVFPTKSEEAVIYKGLEDGDFLVVQRLPRGLISGMKVRAVNPGNGIAYNSYSVIKTILDPFIEMLRRNFQTLLDKKKELSSDLIKIEKPQTKLPAGK